MAEVALIYNTIADRMMEYTPRLADTTPCKKFRRNNALPPRKVLHKNRRNVKKRKSK
jgi:hypothetical protein